MKIWLGIGMAVAMLATAPLVQAQEASFDCDKATAPVEKMICRDWVLARLDKSLADAYRDRRKSLATADAEALTRQQREWLRGRLERCAIPARGSALEAEAYWKAAPCLAGEMRTRLKELGGKEQDPPAPAYTGPSPHPLCVLAAIGDLLGENDGPANATPSVAAAACQKGHSHIPVNRDRPGWLGAPTLTEGYGGDFAYQSIGKLADGTEVLLLNQSGGGTGQFSAIGTLRRQTNAKGEAAFTGAMIIPGGDRCNGGINSAKIDGKDILIDRNATPSDLLGAIGVKSVPDTIPSCAVCCVGTVTTRDSADGEKSALQTITFDDADAVKMVAEVPGGACLAKLIQARKLPYSLPAAEARKLGQDFTRTCKS